MTCDAVRERILAGSTDALSELEPHLSTCPSCAELAAYVRASESHLRQHVEDFVTDTTFDASWARALDQAPPVRANRRLNGAIIAAAAAAVLAVATWQGMPGGEPPEPDGPAISASAGVLPEGLRRAAELREQFYAVETEDLDAQGLARAEEDALLRERLGQKVAALQAVEAALQEVVDGDAEPRDVVTALTGLGDLYAAMADSLEQFTQPSYLNDSQRQAYGDALAGKADAQRGKALEAYQEGLELALAEVPGASAGLASKVRAMEALLAARQVRSPDDDAAGAAEDRRRLEAALDRLQEVIPKCTMDEASKDEVTQVVAQAALTLAEARAAHYADVENIVQAYVDAVTECAEE